ncbi:MAG: hypothetical protein QOE54_2844 [Streptosporangiaceae bacterium]|jgi:hypothetical protein|nr:hypothetical protein [Streptosporangiaceae bacterium]
MDQSAGGARVPRRALLWVAGALSLTIVGPTLAMAGNGQSIAGMHRKGVPMSFLIGLIGVALVGYGFVRPTRTRLGQPPRRVRAPAAPANGGQA